MTYITGNNGLAKQVSDEIPFALNNLRKALGTISPKSVSSEVDVSKQLQQQTTPTTAIKQIREIINKINNTLDKAVTVRIDKI